MSIGFDDSNSAFDVVVEGVNHRFCGMLGQNQGLVPVVVVTIVHPYHGPEPYIRYFNLRKYDLSDLPRLASLLSGRVLENMVYRPSEIRYEVVQMSQGMAVASESRLRGDLVEGRDYSCKSSGYVYSRYSRDKIIRLLRGYAVGESS